MRFIEIELDGKSVRAVVNEAVPVTANAMWDALPFEGRGVHGQIAGEMFRMLDQAPVRELALENGQSYQAPGEVVYLPPRPGAAIAHKLDETGARSIKFRKAADQSSAFKYLTRQGPKLHVEFDGVQFGATLPDTLAPKTVAEFTKILPLEGRAWNDSLSGEVLRFEGERPLNISEPENGKFYSATRELRFCWGQGSVHNLSSVEQLTPITAFDGDWTEFQKRAQAQLTEGAKRLAIRSGS